MTGTRADASNRAPMFASGAAAHRRSSSLSPQETSNGREPKPGARQRPSGRTAAPGFRGRRVQAAYAFIDFFCVVLCSVAAFLLRFLPTGFSGLRATGHLDGMDHRYLGFLLLDVCLVLLFCQSQRLYRTPLERPFSAEAMEVGKAVSLATLVLTAFAYISGVRVVSRLVVAIGAVLCIFALAGWRYAKRQYVIRRIERGVGRRNVLIVGSGEVGQALAGLIEENSLLGYQFVGFLDSGATHPRILGRTEEIGMVARAHFIDEVFVTIPSEREIVKQIAFAARQYRFGLNVVPELYDGLGWNAPLRRIGRFPIMDLEWSPIPRPGLVVKRLIDVALSTVGLVICAPLLGVIAILVRWDSPGPAFYHSLRVGPKGRTFSCYKLRTMVANADQLKGALRGRNEREGPFFKINDDPRITRLGRFLRKYSLDELPQLWNVLIGDMSLVGPRPHPVDDYKLYSLDHLRRLEVKPGITGLWQVTARRDPSFDTSMRLDLEYIEKWDLRLDLEIMARTLSSVIRAEGS